MNEDGTATKIPTSPPKVALEISQLPDKPPEIHEVAFATVLKLADYHLPKIGILSAMARDTDLEGVWKHGYTVGVQAARQLLDATESYWRSVGWKSASQLVLGEKPDGGAWTIAEFVKEVQAKAPPPRTKRMNRHGYEDLVKGDLAWLRQQGSEHSLERKHIELVLTNSVEFEYPDPERPGLDPDRNLVDRLAFAISHLPRDDEGNRKAARLCLDMGMRLGDESSLTALLTEKVKDLSARLETAHAVAEKKSEEIFALEEHLAKYRDARMATPESKLELWDSLTKIIAAARASGVDPSLVTISVRKDHDGSDPRSDPRSDPSVPLIDLPLGRYAGD
jgi:hypothetical protein